MTMTTGDGTTDDTGDAAPADGGVPDPRRWAGFAVCLVVTGLTVMNVSIVNTALPSIQRALSASPSQLQWMVTAYSLSFAVMLVPAGRLGDARGRKPLFMVGLGLFAAASVVCGLVGNAWLLVGARLVQGAASGLLLPQVTAFVQSGFRGAERSRAFGYFGLVNGLSVAVGPLLGGAVLALVPGNLAWRAVFWVNVPIALGALAFSVPLMVPRPGAGSSHLDRVGALLLGVGLLLLLVVIQEASTLGWGRTALVGAAAAAVLGAFVAWEGREQHHGRAPLAPLNLLRHRSFAAGISVGILYFAANTAIFYILTIYLQSGLGYTPLEAGLTQTGFAVASAVAAPLASRYVARFGRRLVAAGLVVFVAGLGGVIAAIELVAPATAVPVGLLVAVPLVICGVGGGLVTSPNTNLTLAGVEAADAGSASGMMATGQRIGSAAGIAAVGAVFYALYGGGPAVAVTGGLVTVAVIVVLALVPALVDLRATTREQRRLRAPAVSHDDHEQHRRAASVP